MAWYPNAVRREVRRFRTPMNPVRVNLHTAVTNTSSLFAFFNQPGQVCSHFYVRKDGTVEQYVDTAYRAAADLNGNPDTISIETWDGYRSGAPGYWRHNSDVPPWTDAQMRSLAALVAWIIKTHPRIPARIARDSKPGSSSHGISWHRLGIDPWRAPGGLKYSNARGKVCPGDRRIGQIPALVTALASNGVVIGGNLPNPTPGTLPGALTPEDDMFSDADATKLDQIHRSVTRYLDLRLSDARNGILAAIAGIPVADVDEKALAPELAKALAPLLSMLPDADIERIAEAVADEQSARLAQR